MTATRDKIQQNLTRIMERLSRAARRSGRAKEAVQLVAITKQVDVDVCRELFELGIRDLGESRPQELWRKRSLLPDQVRWHLVGPLQRNKARRTLPLIALLHSVDSPALLQRLNELSVELELRPDLLIEVNVSGEASKHGVRPEELAPTLSAAAGLTHVRITGLMTMAAWSEDAETARPTFAGLRELRDRLRPSAPPNCPLQELSMGMSGDFEVAIEEGATIVRIGSALFQGLAEPGP
jgi:hypothetical protein